MATVLATARDTATNMVWVSNDPSDGLGTWRDVRAPGGAVVVLARTAQCHTYILSGGQSLEP